MTSTRTRLWQLLDLVAREALHLQGVETRLFSGAEPSARWLDGVLATPEGIDRLESFVGKFARMQDTVMDKLLPIFLGELGERTGSALDNLIVAERLGFVSDPDAWVAMRRLRNRLVHEYVEDTAELAMSLMKARELALQLVLSYSQIRDYSSAHLPRPDSV